MLDAYFKSYFGTFVFAALFGGSFISAKIANVFVDRALRPPVASLHEDTQPVRRTLRKSDQGSKVDPNTFLERNLFEAEREDLTPKPKEVEPKPVEPEKPPVDEGACVPDRCKKSGVPANLLATLWSGDMETSRAIFQATSGGDIEVLKVGQELIGQATVTSILRSNVCVSRAGTCELFSLEEPQKKVRPRVQPRQPVARTPPEPQLGQGVRKLSDKEYEIEKAEIDSVLSNLNTIARQARIVPSFQNGKANGFKLFSIRPNSLYSKIGIQNGDIVQKINGYEMNSPDKALEIYSKLKDAHAISVDLIRRGKPVSMSYTIR